MRYMREKLAEDEDVRMIFTGVFKRFGKKTNNYKGWLETTVLLVNVKNEKGEIVTDHLWFNYTKGFRNLGDLEQGNMIEFHARVKSYLKGYVNRRDYIDERELDYKLSHPSKIRKIN